MSRVLWLALALQFGQGRLDAWLLGVVLLVRVAAELLAASRSLSKLAPWLDLVLLVGFAASCFHPNLLTLSSWPSAWRPG